MADPRIERWSRGSGVIAVVGFLFLYYLGGTPPPADAEAIDIANYYSHLSEFSSVLYTLIAGIGGLAFLVFIGSLSNVLGEAEFAAGKAKGQRPRMTGIAYAGGLVLLGLSFTANAVTSAAIARSAAAGLDIQTAVLFFDLANWLFIYAAIGGAALLGATAALGRRTDVLPKWLSYLGMAGALVVVMSLGVTSVGIAVFPMLMSWVLAASLILLSKAYDAEKPTSD